MSRSQVVLAAVLLSGVAALEVKKDDAVDRYSHFRVNQPLTYAATGLATASSVAALVVTPAMLDGAFPEACKNGIGAMAVKCSSVIQGLKVSAPLELTMAHGFLLKAIAEVLAQIIPQNSDPLGAWIDPLRVIRSTLASLLSSSLTFFYWTRLPFVRSMTAPGFVRAMLGKVFGTSVTKMFVTQLCYRPINVGLFLAMQSIFRGDTARQFVNVMRSKFKGGLIGGIAFFSVSNMIMFSVPVPFLHPVIGASACAMDPRATHHPCSHMPCPASLRSCRPHLQCLAGDRGLRKVAVLSVRFVDYCSTSSGNANDETSAHRRERAKREGLECFRRTPIEHSTCTCCGSWYYIVRRDLALGTERLLGSRPTSLLWLCSHL